MKAAHIKIPSVTPLVLAIQQQLYALALLPQHQLWHADPTAPLPSLPPLLLLPLPRRRLRRTTPAAAAATAVATPINHAPTPDTLR
jgi:hypothetical protein